MLFLPFFKERWKENVCACSQCDSVLNNIFSYPSILKILSFHVLALGTGGVGMVIIIKNNILYFLWEWLTNIDSYIDNQSHSL